MNLNLTKAIVFFDLETTGLNISTDKIIEIALLKINPDQSEEEFVKRINPGMLIPAESTEIHGITNADVKDCVTFDKVAEEIKAFIGDADLAGYNSNRFDVPFLIEELLNVNVQLDLDNRRFIDVQTIFHKMEQRTLEAALKFYCDEELNNAHNAAADTLATYKVLKGQLDRYPDTVKNDMDFLAEFSQNNGKNKKIDFVGRLAINDKNEPIYNFGKHAGKTLAEVYEQEPGYYRWILDNNFPKITKAMLNKHMAPILEKAKIDRQKRREYKTQKMENKINQLKDKFNN